jgi:hypothetical protein
MCFSSYASFGSAAILSTIGIATLRQAKVRAVVPFATIPLLFGIQQLAEGALWLALEHPGHDGLRGFSTILFLFFAQVVWPVWVPFSICKLEQKPEKKRVLRLMVWTGAVVSAYLAYCLLRYEVKAEIEEHHIFYEQDYPATPGFITGALYLACTLVPQFISSAKRMVYLAVFILVSFALSAVLYQKYFISVWCFFAAAISIWVYAIVRKNVVPALPAF